MKKNKKRDTQKGFTAKQYRHRLLALLLALAMCGGAFAAGATTAYAEEAPDVEIIGADDTETKDVVDGETDEEDADSDTIDAEAGDNSGAETDDAKTDENDSAETGAGGNTETTDAETGDAGAGNETDENITGGDVAETDDNSDAETVADMEVAAQETSEVPDAEHDDDEEILVIEEETEIVSMEPLYEATPFAKFSFKLDTTEDGMTEKSAGSYTSDNVDEMLLVPDFGTIDKKDLALVMVTFSSKNGRVKFGYPNDPRSALGAYSMDAASFLNLADSEGGLGVFRNGAGAEEITITAQLPDDYSKKTEVCTIKLTLAGWETFVDTEATFFSTFKLSGRYFRDGKFLSGWQSLRKDDGELVLGAGTEKTYFDPTTKVMARGLTKIDGKTYFFDEQNVIGASFTYMRKGKSGREIVSPFYSEGLAVYEGQICVDMDGALVTGRVTVGGNIYWFDEHTFCKAVDTWIYPEEGKQAYADSAGALYIDGIIKPAAGGVYLLKDGVLQKGWAEYTYSLSSGTQTDKYYCDPVSGAIAYGFITVNKKTYLQTKYGDNEIYNAATGKDEAFGGIPRQKGVWYCSALGAGGYFTDENGVLIKNKEVEIDGEWFYADSDGAMFTGYKKVGKMTYLYTESGREDISKSVPQVLSVEDDSVIGYGYTDKSGNLVFYTDASKKTILKNTFAHFYNYGMKRIYLDAKGMISYGWKTIDKKKYYFDKQTGHMIFGAENLHEVEGKLWYFNKDGYVEQPEESKRWVPVSGDTRYYVGKNGAPVTGWQTIDGEKYYFEKDGKQNLDGWIGGKYYLLKSNGSVYLNQQGQKIDIDGQSYFLNKDGSVKTGWNTVKSGEDAGTYYILPLRPELGVVRASIGAKLIYLIGGKYYGFGPEGKRLYGWQNLFTQGYWDAATGSPMGHPHFHTSWFYFDQKTGVMATGKKKIAEAHPDLGTSGVFYFSAAAIDDRETDYRTGELIVGGVIKSGSKLTTIMNGQEYVEKSYSGIAVIRDESYYLLNGKVQTGAKAVNGDQYFFDKSTGVMARNKLLNISGKWYYYGADGRRVTDNLTATAIAADGVDEKCSATFHKTGYITGWKSVNTGDPVKDARLLIGGKTYFLNSKGAPVKGLYTQNDKTTTWLVNADYTIATSAENRIVQGGSKHYIVDGEGRVLKNGRFKASESSLTSAYTAKELDDMEVAVLNSIQTGISFYTDKNGVVIKNKTVTAASGKQIRLGKYGLPAGPLVKISGKWYAYDENGALSPGTYEVEAMFADTSSLVTVTFKVGKNGQLTEGFKRADGKNVEGFVEVFDGVFDFAVYGRGYYYLNKNGIPQTGTKTTSDGKITFHATSGLATSLP